MISHYFKNMRLGMKFGAMAVILAGTIYAYKQPQKISLQGETVIADTIGKSDIIVKIKTHIVETSELKDPRFAITKSICPDPNNFNPCSLVDGIEIYVNHDTVIVPVSVYSSLFNLDDVIISKNKMGYQLLFNGADASEGYTLKVRFNSIKVKQTELGGGECSGSRPDEVNNYAPPDTCN